MVFTVRPLLSWEFGRMFGPEVEPMLNCHEVYWLEIPGVPWQVDRSQPMNGFGFSQFCFDYIEQGVFNHVYDPTTGQVFVKHDNLSWKYIGVVCPQKFHFDAFVNTHGWKALQAIVLRTKQCRL